MWIEAYVRHSSSGIAHETSNAFKGDMIVVGRNIRATKKLLQPIGHPRYNSIRGLTIIGIHPMMHHHRSRFQNDLRPFIRVCGIFTSVDEAEDALDRAEEFCRRVIGEK